MGAGCARSAAPALHKMKSPAREGIDAGLFSFDDQGRGNRGLGGYEGSSPSKQSTLIAVRSSVRRLGAEQIGELGDIHRDPPRLIPRHQSRRGSSPRLVLEIDVGERVTVRVAHDKTVLTQLHVRIINGPRRRESTLGHAVLTRAAKCRNMLGPARLLTRTRRIQRRLLCTKGRSGWNFRQAGPCACALSLKSGRSGACRVDDPALFPRGECPAQKLASRPPMWEIAVGQFVPACDARSCRADGE
jgi:hypothetical protein